MKIKAVSCLVLPWLCVVLASAAQAQSTGGQEALYVRALAATCANCHGTDGKAVAGGSVTSLAGLDKSYFLAQMAAFKNGTRPATLMHQISRGFNDAQIESLASFFALQNK